MKCLTCLQIFRYNRAIVERMISEYFLCNEHQNSLNLKFLNMINKNHDSFCKECINLGLYLHESDEESVSNRLKIYLKRFK